MANPLSKKESMFFFEKKNQKTFAIYPQCGQAASGSATRGKRRAHCVSTGGFL
jgi:hypothetical protein